jgi:signal transduction histidine kinase
MSLASIHFDPLTVDGADDGRARFGAYALAFAGTIAALALSDGLSSGLAHAPFVFCYVAVALSALYGGLGPALLSTFVGIVGVSYLLLPPRHTMRIERPADVLSVIAFTVVAVAVSSLTNSLRRALWRAARLAQLHEAQTIELTNSNSALDQARKQAEAASEAKSRFLGMVSHELRTPINAALGYADLLAENVAGPLTEQQRGYVVRILDANRHLASLVGDILDVMTSESGRLTVVREAGDVTQPVEEALSLVRPHADARGVDLVYARPPDDAPVPYLGDVDRVRQVVLNLVTNAIKFTERDGRITVTCGTTNQPTPDAAIRDGREWTYVRVEDTGCGIRPEHLRMIFEPFVQAPNGGNNYHSGGTGLGLAISRQLARLMGGDVSVRSTPGAGSTFTLWLGR